MTDTPQSTVKKSIDVLQLYHLMEQGRNEILRLIARGEPLMKILRSLCQKMHNYDSEMICAVQLLDDTKGTLHCAASVALPDSYNEALDGIAIGLSVASWGTSAFTKQRVVIEDINTHPYWAQYKMLALEANLQSCYSEPIIGFDDKVYGTLTVYHRQPGVPRAEELQFIEVSANLAAVVCENEATRQVLFHANEQLNQTIDDRNEQLELANQELLSVLAEQDLLRVQQINAEKVLTTNSLLTGFAHEINTPVGIAITAISTAENQLEQLMSAFNSGKLTRKTMSTKVAMIKDSIELNKNNLTRTSELLSTFKSMNFKFDQQESGAFELSRLFAELPAALASLLKDFKLKVECEGITLHHSRNAFWQVMHQLIENSVIHGFHGRKTGLIHISAAKRQKELVISYQDNGCGIQADLQQQIFEPFYSTKRTRGSIGLGLNVVMNIITNNFNGKIYCLKAPIGIRFEIVLPLKKQ
jgi:signal transduction histidine kinase